jgi:hypothetical protein
VGADRFEAFKLDKTLSLLATHISSEVRKRVAAGFGEIANILSRQSYQLLRIPFMKLVGDQEIDICHSLLQNFEKILSQFSLDESILRVCSP